VKALAIDLGGTHATCAVVRDGEILASRVIDLDCTNGLASALPLFSSALREAAQNAGVETHTCDGLALSFCGLVDARTGRVVSTNKKYDDAVGIDLPAWSCKEFGLPFRIENDARMALLGEWYAGGGRGYDNIVMFTLGTGIGGAAMVEGRLLRGKHFQAGCLGGHFPVLFTGRKCTCGNVGCAEAEASGWAIPEVARATPGFESSTLAAGEVTFKAVFQAAAAGDPVAVTVRDRCLHVWAANSVAAIHAYDPELIIFGGGVMKSADVILPYVERFVHEHAWTPWGKVAVRSAELANNAALLGAVPLLTEKFGSC